MAVLWKLYHGRAEETVTRKLQEELEFYNHLQHELNANKARLDRVGQREPLQWPLPYIYNKAEVCIRNCYTMDTKQWREH